MPGLVYSHSTGTRRISSKSDEIRTDGENTFIGSAPNRTKITQKGMMTFEGEATVWDEISQPFIGRNLLVVTGRVDYNYDELTVDYTTTARYPEEPVGVVLQLPHARKAGSDFHPHLHWIQTSDAVPNILIAYRTCNNNEVYSDWTLKALTAVNSKYPYVLNGMQITEFDLPEGHGETLGLSATFECKIYRDSLNTSGLFAGADGYTGNWSIKYYDIHFEKDSIGSNEEYTK